MIAGRRARQRPLLRTSAIAAAIARNLSVVDGMVRRPMDRRSIQQDDSGAQPVSSMIYLQQLSTLHTAGVLTDEEFAAAKGRLFGL